MKPIFALFLLALAAAAPSLAFASPGTATVSVNGATYDVSYDATGLTVNSMEADTATDALTIFTSTGDLQSTLQVVLDRNFFDSQVDGEDEDFIVLADGFETPFDEAKTDTARTLTITVPPNTSSLDIISLGTDGFATPSETTETPSETPTETPSETPGETPTETPSETPSETPEQQESQCGPGTVLKDGACVVEEQCGPGTVLKDGACVLEEQPPETPTETPEQEKQTCGLGTVLKDGQCVLEEGCGPGTVMKDGQCVIKETPQSSGLPQGGSFQLGLGIIVAFIIAFVVMLILWGIGKAGRRKSNSQ